MQAPRFRSHPLFSAGRRVTRGVPPRTTIKSTRAGEVRELYANDRGFAVIDQFEAVGQSHGKTVAQTALAWLLTNPVVTAPIVGANTAEQLKDSLGAAGYRLSPPEMESLHALTKYPRNWRPISDQRAAAPMNGWVRSQATSSPASARWSATRGWLVVQ